MIKKIFVVWALCLGCPVWADGLPEMYGKVNLGLQRTETLPGNIWELKSNASRFGVKGDFALGEETKALYILEWEVDTSEAAGVNSNIKARNQAIGLQGAWGKVLGGRYDTPFKLAQNKIDLFNDYDGDLRSIFSGETRANNVAQYSSPVWAGFSFNVATLLQETVDANTAVTEGRNGLFDATSISIEYAPVKNLYFALAQDSDHVTGVYQEGAKALRFVTQYTLDAWQFGLLWQSQQEADGIDTDGSGGVLSSVERLQFDLNKDGAIDKTNGSLFSVAYELNENGTLKLEHGKADIRMDGGKQSSVGYDQRIAKNVKLFYWYTTEDQSVAGKEKNMFAAGLEVKF